MKTILIGSVKSSQTVLTTMIRESFPINFVFSLDEQYSEGVSGYYPIHNTAKENGIPFKRFKRICDSENIEKIKEIAPDYIFVIGLSQIVSKELINAAKKGVIGFHPTPLPKYRGRAAMVWQMLLGEKHSKCTMFFIDEGMDSGPIIAQEPYEIGENDYADDVENNLLVAMEKLTSKVLHQIVDGTIHAVEQDESKASYLLIRRPEDGHISWEDPVEKVHLLVRAVSHPYPGAFGLYDGEHKIIIWRGEVLENHRYIGIPGQICEIDDDSFTVLGSNGLLKVTSYTNVDDVKLFVGHKLR